LTLTDVKVRQAKPAELPYKLTDGNGLHLFITPAGGRFWRLRYQKDGKERLVSLGTYPEMSLRQARDRRNELRAQLRNGGTDPQTTSPPTPTLAELVRQWHDVQKGRWKLHHAKDVLTSLQREILPSLGARPVTEVTAVELLGALRPLESRGAVETAHRIRQRLDQAFAFAIASGIARDNPAAAIRAAMAPMPRKGHRPAILDLETARAMLRDAEKTPALPATLLALRFLALTATRPGEVRLARWTEFEDLDGKEPLWRIPAARMKRHREHTGQDHLVPLSCQAVEVLDTVRVLTGRMPFAFPSRNSAHKPMSENALSYLMGRAGYHGRHVPHGWRASFSTIMNERFPLDRAIIDLMLAHVPKDKVEAAYNRPRHMDRRRELAQIWADLLLEGVPPVRTLIGERE
jgi:integrase